jgi:hypothetical protein
MYVNLQYSTRDDKKYMVKFYNDGILKIVHFGDPKYEDFTMHKNPVRKLFYLNRHRSNEDWHNYLTAGFWSRWLLWNKPTLQQSIKDLKKKFNIEIYF